MSGVEVVGLVLGALPLAIKAAKTYQAIISIKNAGNELGALVRDLETEQALLRDTCEHLLTGIAEVSQIDQLIEDPFGPAWEPYSEAIRLRLWTSQSAIESKLADMKSAALELKSKLSIAADGKVNCTTCTDPAEKWLLITLSAFVDWPCLDSPRVETECGLHSQEKRLRRCHVKDQAREYCPRPASSKWCRP